MNRKELKANALECLKGKYWEAIKLYITYLLVTLFGSIIISLFVSSNENLTSILELIFSVVIMGFYLGFYSFFLKISRNEEVSYKELFNKTDLFWVSIGISFLAGIFTFLLSFLFIIPGIIASLGYSMVYFIALDNPDLNCMEILKKSKNIMKGHKWELFILILSFIGWSILSVFTFGILTLWLVPYMQVTFANFYNKIKD